MDEAEQWALFWMRNNEEISNISPGGLKVKTEN